MKTSELTGAALDWAVAKAWQSVYSDKHLMEHAKGFTPSTDWAQGGPIVERERIAVWGDNPFWEAERGLVWCNGPTPLIAAMRCYVASKLGDDVTLPHELEQTA